MSIDKINFRDIKFTRDSKVDYEKGNPIINTVFAQYDKDLNGSFSEEEYQTYEKEMEIKQKRQEEIKNKKVNKSVINHYDNKILKTQQKYENLSLKMKNENIDFDAFNKLLEFEKAHPDIERCGYTNKKEIPKDAMKYDISSFEMGIYDKGKYTGECYKNGYIAGLEKLTAEEKSQYLTLLENASNSSKKIVEYREKFDNLDKQLDKYFSLKDMAKNGILKSVGTEESENQAYQQYRQIRSDANPFYKQIKELEKKQAQLLSNGLKTDEDKRLFEQYRIQIIQLEQTSKNWSLSDMNTKTEINLNQGKGFEIRELQEKAVYSSQSKSISNIHSAEVGYSNANWDVSANFSETDKYDLHGNTQHTYEAGQRLEYAKGKLKLSENTSFTKDDSSLDFTQQIDAKYGRYGVSISENINQNKFEEPDEQGNLQEKTTTAYTTTISPSVKTGKFDNTATIQFAPDGTSYSLGTGTNIDFNTKNLNFSLSPSMNVLYNQGTKTTTVSPSASAMLMYQKGDFNSNISISDYYSNTLKNGVHPSANNNFSINTALSFKGFGTGFNFSDNDSSYSHTNTYGANLSYTNKKVGRFFAEYTHSKNHNKMQGNNTYDDRIQLTYSAPLDTINSWFKKK